MMVKKEKKEEGFTLIEVLVTIMVLGIVLISLVSCFIYGFNILSRMKQVSIATQCAQEQLEDIRSKTFDEIVALGTESDFTNDKLDLLGSWSGCSDAAGIINVQDDALGADIKKLTVTVQWDYRGHQMQEDIVTFVTREGINKK